MGLKEADSVQNLTGVFFMLVILVCLAAVILLAGSFFAYKIAFYSPPKNREKVNNPADPQYDPYRPEMKRIYHQLNNRPYERVSIVSDDGLRLEGRYYHVKDGAPLDIGVHGYRSNPVTDFSGGSEMTFQMEHNLLLIEQRAHGKSEGRTITFGILERRDLLCWINYAVERFGPDVKILLYGVSMGGATVLMASELDLPENVKGIIADCPYSSPLDVILHVGKTTAFPQWLIKPFAILSARIFGGFDLLETDAARAVKHTKVPILIVHGDADRYVPCEMSDLVSVNPAMVQRHTFPGAPHGISYLTDTPRYHKIAGEFIHKVLS
jgi:pimeloyl-ACP methyl ester carboxylesterase